MNLFHHFHHVGVNDEPLYQQRRSGRMEHTGTAASALALSVPVAAGALLLKTENLLGIGATLMLLTALALAFLGGAALARWRTLRNRPALAILRHGFLLAAAGWLLMLLMLFGARLAGPAAGPRPRRPGPGRRLPHGGGGERGLRRGVQADDGGDSRGRSGCRFAGANLCGAGDKGSLFRAGAAGRSGLAGGVDGADCGA